MKTQSKQPVVRPVSDDQLKQVHGGAGGAPAQDPTGGTRLI
jgi:hypothetical protein